MKIFSGLAYTLFKYAMYALLFINTIYFFEMNSAAEAATFKDGVSFGDIIVAYADAIDSASWLLLLLLFEFETSYDPPERHEKWIQPLIGFATLLCWAVIVYSFYGYYGSVAMLDGFERYVGADACGRAGTDALFAASLDNYVALDAENCRSLAAGAYYNADLDMFATRESFGLLRNLIWVDVVNAGTWIIVAAIIELEIFMRVTGRMTPQFLRKVTIIKAPFWAILVIAVFVWLANGEPVDAWDAFLWIAAFVFIEVNMIAKQESRAQRRARARNESHLEPHSQ